MNSVHTVKIWASRSKDHLRGGLRNVASQDVSCMPSVAWDERKRSDVKTATYRLFRLFTVHLCITIITRVRICQCSTILKLRLEL